MKTLNVAAVLALLSVPSWGAFPNGYTYQRSITIDHTKVPNSNQAGFPVLLCFNGGTGTVCDAANSNTLLPNLKSTGNGGEVQHTVTSTVPYSHTICADCIITDYSGVVLPFEVDNYVASTGETQIWVKVTLSHTTDTTLFIYYGNSSVTTDQSTPHSVWDSDYKFVAHLNESSNPYHDSTTNSATSTGGTYPSQAAAQIGRGQTFTAASSQYIQFTNPLPTKSAYTFSAWVKTNSTGAASVIYDTRGNQYLEGGALYLDATPAAATYVNNIPAATSTTNLSGAWHYIVGDYDGNTGTKLYVDGALITSSSGGGVASFTAGNANIGSVSAPNLQAYFDGIVDEVHASAIRRSADWIATEYNNQSSPNTFYNLGTETTWVTGYIHRRSITIDHTKVPNTDQTGFPVLLCFNGGTGTICDAANSTQKYLKF